jgi:hypothetical protein
MIRSLSQFKIVFALSLIVTACCANANDKSLIEAHSASYQAHISQGISLNGDATRELTQLEDGSWSYRFYVETTPAEITERSIFELIDGKIKPRQYDYLLSGFLIKDRRQSVVFDQSNGTLTEKYKKKQWELSAPDNILDRLNYQLQLQVDVGSGDKEFEYKVIHKGKVRHYRFEVIGEESIQTSLGTKRAQVVQKLREGGKKRETKLWFDQAPPYALLKMIQTEPDGEYYEINITGLTSDTPPASSTTK